jgi:ankyrin repeat protein
MKNGLWTPYLESCTFPEATPKFPWLVPGGTALHVAAWNRNSDALDVLLAHGANANAKALDGRTPLHYAVDVGCAISTVKLLQHGVAPRCPDLEHITPFALACIAGNVEMVKILIQFEDEKTAVDICGSTALHHAARNSQLQTFIYLLDAGWDPYQLDRSFCSPVYYAIEHQRLATFGHEPRETARNFFTPQFDRYSLLLPTLSRAGSPSIFKHAGHGPNHSINKGSRPGKN